MATDDDLNPDELDQHLIEHPELVERLHMGLDQLARGEGTEREW